MNADELLEKVCIAKCKRRNTRQCAPICLSSFSSSPKCDYAKQVWGDDARAAIATVVEACAEMNEFTLKEIGAPENSGIASALRSATILIRALAPKAEEPKS